MRDDVLSEGIEMAMEFGKNWLQPIQGRLQVRYPGLSAEELELYNSTSQQAMRRGHQVVPSCFRDARGQQGPAYRAFSQVMRADYPWLTEGNLSHLFSQGCYYAWKDGALP